MFKGKFLLALVIISILAVNSSYVLADSSENDSNFLKNLWYEITSLLDFKSHNQLQRNGETQIGYEFTEGFLHTWNQNPDGESRANIWQNESSGFLQFFNGETLEEARERSTWATFSFSLCYYSPSGLFKCDFSKDHLGNATMDISSDNATKWVQYLYKCLDFGEDKEFCAGYKRGQNLYDKYMDNFLYFSVNETQAPFNFERNMSSVWEFKNINIGNNGIEDYVEYCYIELLNESDEFPQSKCDYFSLNNNMNLTIYNLTSFYLIDSITKEGHEILWNETTDVRLRYNHTDLMLEFPIGMLINWSGVKSVKTWWIDAGETESSTYTSNLDQTLMQSGYIEQATALGTKVSYNNTPPQVGKTDAGQATEKEKVAFKSYNISIIPNSANITSVEECVIYSSQFGSNTNWRSDFYSGTYAVNDNEGLEIGDWNDGNLTLAVDWSDYCSSNNPCTVCLNLGATAILDAKYSVDNKAWFFTKEKDNSLYRAGDDYGATYGTTGAFKTQLIVNFTLPDDFNVNQTYPENNTVFNVTDSIQIDLKGIVGGAFESNFCYFQVNDTLRINNTNVANGSIGYSGNNSRMTYFNTSDVGKYYWNVSCEDIWGHTDYSEIWAFTILNTADYINVSQVLPLNNSVFNMTDSSIDINFNWSVNSTFGLEYCNLTVNGINYQTNFKEQEDANNSVCEGDWFTDYECSNVTDGDWETFGITTPNLFPPNYGQVYLNYSKPSNVFSTSRWQVKDNDAIANLTIPAECWALDPLEFRVNSTFIHSIRRSATWYCYNGASWVLLRDYDSLSDPYSNAVYEEAMIWDGLNIDDTISLTFNTAGEYFWNVTCFDEYDYAISTPATWRFTIESISINLTGNILSILPYQLKYPYVRLNDSIVSKYPSIGINESNSTLIFPYEEKYPEIILNETNITDISPNKLKYPYVRLNRSTVF